MIYSRTRGINQNTVSFNEPVIRRDISPFKESTSIFMNQPAYTHRPLIQNEPPKIVYQNFKRSKADINKFKAKVASNLDEVDKFKQHIRIATFSRFTTSIFIMLLKYIVVQEIMNYAFGQRLIQNRFNNMLLLALAIGYLFFSAIQFTETMQAKSIIVLMKDIWNNPIIVRPVVLKALIYSQILSLAFGSQVDLASYLIIAAIDCIFEQWEREFQVDFINEGILAKTVFDIAQRTITKTFKYKNRTLRYALIIFIFNREENYLRIILFSIMICFIKLLLRILEEVLKYEMVGKEPIKIIQVIGFLQMKMIPSSEKRTSIIAIKDLESIFEHQSSLKFNEFVKDANNLNDWARILDDQTTQCLEVIKSINEEIKQRKRDENQLRKSTNIMGQQSNRVKIPQWYDKFGMDWANYQFVKIQNYGKLVLNFDQIIHQIQKMSLLSECNLQIVRYLRTNNQYPFNPDEFDVKRYYNIIAKFAQVYMELSEVASIMGKNYPQLYSMSANDIVYSLLQMHQSIQREFALGMKVQSKIDQFIDKSKAYDCVKIFKNGLI